MAAGCTLRARCYTDIQGTERSSCQLFMGQNKTFMEAVAFWCSGEGNPQGPEPESAVYLHDFSLCAKPCTGPTCQLRLLRPGISNSSICTTVGTKELKNGSTVTFLLPGSPDQGFCCILDLWWGQASPEPVRTFPLTPVTAPALETPAVCVKTEQPFRGALRPVKYFHGEEGTAFFLSAFTLALV